MATSAVAEPVLLAADQQRTGRRFAVAMLAVCGISCALAGWAPLGYSILIVFLFAGPHNLLEARYMIGRMPPRWGTLRPYFLTGLIGIPLLTGITIGVPRVLGASGADREVWLVGIATANSLILIWIMILVLLRSRQNPPRPGWVAAIPIGFLLIGVNWLYPLAWSVALIYLHPLLALWFLDRELGKRRNNWQRVYRRCLMVIPLLLLAILIRLGPSSDLPGDDVLTLQITRHAGAGVIRGISSHALVASHAFLEMLHYAIWIMVMPILTFRTVPWNLTRVPLAKSSKFWRAVLVGLLAFGLIATLVLWAGFLVDYPLTRDIYFTLAMLHVFAEIPFLLRLL